MITYVEKTKSKITGRVANWKKGNSYLHQHENCEICTILNKPCKFLVEGELISAEVGDIVVMHESVVHQFIIENDNTDIHIMHIGLNCFVDFETILKPLKIHITSAEINAVPGLAKELKFLRDMIDKEERIIKSGKENPVLLSISAALYYLLMRHFPEEENRIGTKKGRKEFYEILDFINNNYKDDITVTSIAEQLFMSRKKVSALFLEFSATKITEYINVRRIKNVNLLLSNGTGITEAAIESGFQSLRTFNDIYKKYTGVTPTEYIKSLENK